MMAATLSAQQTASDAKLDGYNGNVKKVTRYTYEVRTDFTGSTSQGDLLEHLETAYNSKGWRKTMTYVTPEADVIFRSRFKHDGFGLTTVEQIVDNNENVIGRTYYVYNADHQLIEMYVEVDGEPKIASASHGDRTGEIGNFYENSATFKAYRWAGYEK